MTRSCAHLFSTSARRGLGFRIQGSGFRVQGSGFRFWGVGSRGPDLRFALSEDSLWLFERCVGALDLFCECPDFRFLVFWGPILGPPLLGTLHPLP